MLYNRRTKQWEDIPDNQVTEKVASGEYALEANTQIPVVNVETGKVASIPSEDAQEAFKSGLLRASTVEDVRQQSTAEEEAAIKEKYFGSPAQAAIAGGLRGATLGLSDVAFKAAGVGEEAAELARQSPTASMLGELAGGTALGLGVGGIKRVADVTRAVEAASTAKSAAMAAKILQSAKAAETIGAIGGKAAVGALEGAVYGLGTGVSEAALYDKPALEAMAAGGLNGFVAGGLFGAGFGGAYALKNPLQNLLETPLSRLNDSAQKVINNVTVKGVVSGLETAGQAGEAAALKPLLTEKGLLDEIFQNPSKVDDYLNRLNNYRKENGIKIDAEAKAAQAQIKAEAKLLDKQRKDLVKGLEKDIASFPKELEKEIAVIASDAQGSLSKVLVDLENLKNQQYADFYEQLAQKEPKEFGQAMQDAYAFGNKLKQSSGMYERSLGNKIIERIEAQKVNPITTGLDEYKLYKDIRTLLPFAKKEGYKAQKSLKNIDNFRIDKDSIESFRSDWDNKYLKGNPDPVYQQNQAKLDQFMTAYSDLKNSVYVKLKGKELAGIISDPEKSNDFVALAKGLSNYSDDLTKWKATASEKLAEKQAILDKVNQKIREARNSSDAGNLDLDDMEEIVNAFKGIDKGDRLAKVREVEQRLASIDINSPLEVAVAQKAALKQNSAKLLEDYAEFESGLTVLGGLQAAQRRTAELEGSNIGKKLLDAAIKRGVSGVAGAIGGPVAGAAVEAGRLAFNAASFMTKGASNPYAALQTGAKIAKYVQKSTDTMNKAVAATVESMVSDKARRVVSIPAISSRVREDLRSTETQKKEFPQLMDNLDRMSNPNEMLSAVEQSIPGYIENMPMLQADLYANNMKIVNFLQSKRPLVQRDPITNKALTPSDNELSKFFRYVDAVQDPTQVLVNIAKNRVTVEEVEVLKTIYPNMLDSLREKTLDAIITKGKKPTYQQRVMMSQLFDIDMDSSVKGSFIQQMQKPFIQDKGGRPAESGGQKIPNASGVSLNAENVQTETSRISNK